MRFNVYSYKFWLEVNGIVDCERARLLYLNAVDRKIKTDALVIEIKKLRYEALEIPDNIIRGKE